MKSFAVLIPTRNRPRELKNLLLSLSLSTVKPDQVVIVASGVDVSVVVEDCKSLIEITYVHTKTRGQIAQKRIGVDLIRADIDWCLFLDDDLLIEPETIEIAFKAMDSHNSKSIVGIGLGLSDTSRVKHSPLIVRKLARIFKLEGRKPGEVLASGHAVGYLSEANIVETDWLNGASIWRIEHVREYGKDLPSTDYAACEDLIFSFPLRKLGTLIFVPNARVYFQKSEMSDYDSFEVLRAASLWRYYFVSAHKELSVGWFLLGQTGRSLYSVFKKKSGKTRLALALVKLHLEIIRNWLSDDPPKQLLTRLMHQEIEIPRNSSKIA